MSARHHWVFLAWVACTGCGEGAPDSEDIATDGAQRAEAGVMDAKVDLGRGEDAGSPPGDAGTPDAPPTAPDAAPDATDATDAGGPRVDAGTRPDSGLGADTISYHLSWETDGAERLESGAWRIRTDLDYEVELRAGHLVSHSVQLVECPEESMGLRLQRILGLGVAHAGHGDAANPVEVYEPLVESLTELGRVHFGSRETTGATYCRIHYLVARALEAETRELPDPELVGRTLRLEGTWRRGGEGAVDFAFETGLAWGALRDIADGPEAEPFQLDSRQGGARVDVERQLATVFDGLDFAEGEVDDWGRAVLRNLLVDTRFSVEPR